MPKKPVEFGIKLWCLCDANTGYCIAFNVYTGRNEDQTVNLDLDYKVVMRNYLQRNYLQRYHHVYAQIIFSHLYILQKQSYRQTRTCVARRMPSAKSSRRLSRKLSCWGG